MGKKTVRLSLKTIALMFPEHSIQRIYLHGKWQMSRGRNPSLNTHNQNDPKLSFQVAKAIVGEYFDDIFAEPFSRHDFFWRNYFLREERIRSSVIGRQPAEYI
jgi:hypothetical protein